MNQHSHIEHTDRWLIEKHYYAETDVTQYSMRDKFVDAGVYKGIHEDWSQWFEQLLNDEKHAHKDSGKTWNDHLKSIFDQIKYRHSKPANK